MPSFILMAIAVPSFSLLYAIDEIIDPSVTLKAIGHQWYRSYEYSDYAAKHNTIELIVTWYLPRSFLKVSFVYWK